MAVVSNRDYVEAALRVVDGQVELRAQGLPIYDGHTDILATNLSKMHFHKLDFGGGPPTQIFGTHSELQRSFDSSRAFVGLCLVPVALSVAYWAVLIYLPLFLQHRLGNSSPA